MTIKRRIQRLERVTFEPAHAYRDPCSGIRKLRAFLGLPPLPQGYVHPAGESGTGDPKRTAAQKLEAFLASVEQDKEGRHDHQRPN
jgi:hypothetical protein